MIHRLDREQPSLLDDVLREARDELSGWKSPSLGELATAILAAVVVVVAMGAFVYWLHAGNAGLPRIQTLSIIPKPQLIVVGVWQLLVPMLLTLALSAVALPFGGAAGRRRAEREFGEEGLSAGEIKVRVVKMAELRDLVQGAMWGLAAALAVFSPLGWSMWVSTCALLVYGFVVVRRGVGTKALLGIALVSSFCFGLAREADAGVRFETVRGRLSSGVAITRYYLAASGESTYIAYKGEIEAIPTRRIDRLAIGHSPTSSPGTESIANHIAEAVDSLF